MASLRRSKALSPDGQTARFLYTILKQLDLKTIDWNLVADGLDITNGHAARMRFSRFKQHMEGLPSQPRTPRPKKDSGKDKTAKEKGLKRGLEDCAKEEDVKAEKGEVDEPSLKFEPSSHIKNEPRLTKESNGIEEPPAVRVKRESGADSIGSQADGGADYRVLPVQDQDLIPTTNLAFALPTAPGNQAKPAIVSPPIATVSLADLHLSPSSIPYVPQFDRTNLNFGLAARTVAPQKHGYSTVTRIKHESDWLGSPVQAIDGHPLVKSEPICP